MNTSSPTTASAIARRMSGEGFVTVSDRKSMGASSGMGDILERKAGTEVSIEAVRRDLPVVSRASPKTSNGETTSCSASEGKCLRSVDLEPPYSIAFKCSDEVFGELIERPGIIPAPYLARAKWVQETEFGEALDLRELAGLLRDAHEPSLPEASEVRRPGPGADRA